MSHLQVQRVVIRMLYDPDFAAAVYAAPARALALVSLDEEERRWLVAPDPRAYRTDPYRRARTLQGLVEEFAVSSALAVRGGSAGVAALDSFFSSSLFHGCIQERGSLADAFGRFLEERAAGGPVGALARLERGLARVRRGTSAPPPAATGAEALRLSPRVDVMTLPEGTLALWEDVRARMQAAGDPIQAILSETLALPAAPVAQRAAREHLVVEARAEGRAAEPGISIEHAPPALAGLLEAAREPRRRADLEAEAIRLGAAVSEAASIVADLVTQGLLFS